MAAQTTSAPPVRRSPRNKGGLSAVHAGETTISSHISSRHAATTTTRLVASPSREADRRYREAASARVSTNGGGAGASRSSRDYKTDTTGGSTRNNKTSGSNGRHKEDAGGRFQSPSPRRTAAGTATTIALPTSDTPVIARNKEMRRKAAEGTGRSAGDGGRSTSSGSSGSSNSNSNNRRSSLGTRGRRASSLMESGQAATPHREVNAREFYKHISDEGILEPMRMKQLLIWCAERALPEKPRQGVPSTSPALGGRSFFFQFKTRNCWFGALEEQKC